MEIDQIPVDHRHRQLLREKATTQRQLKSAAPEREEHLRSRLEQQEVAIQRYLDSRKRKAVPVEQVEQSYRAICNEIDEINLKLQDRSISSDHRVRLTTRLTFLSRQADDFEFETPSALGLFVNPQIARVPI